MNEQRQGYIGNPEQLCSVRRVTVAQGRAKGTDIIEVYTADGLQLDILPDAGLDIGQARYKGINVSWLSKNGYDSPAVISACETEFLNTFPGGLLYTCGLRNAGPANRDNGEWHPLHGRYHSLAADYLSIEKENDEIVVKGTLRETALFKHVLEVKRVIRIPVYGASVTVQDVITNQTPHDEEIMRVYHCNFGYPLLSEKAQLVLPSERETIARTEFAKTGLDRTCTFEPPVKGEEERVFFQKMKKDFSATIKNPEIGVTMKMRWSGDTLPILSEWRSMAAGDYVLGLEPSNCYIMGRSEERKNGTLPVLKAFESMTHTIEMTFLEEKKDG